MTKRPIYTEPGEVSVEDGSVALDGPDDIHVAMTPDAAEETSERLMTGVLKARGQRYFEDRRPKNR
jgi:hypothetical protein